MRKVVLGVLPLLLGFDACRGGGGETTTSTPMSCIADVYDVETPDGECGWVHARDANGQQRQVLARCQNGVFDADGDGRISVVEECTMASAGGGGDPSGGLAAYTFYTCVTATDVNGERLYYRVNDFNNARSVIDLVATRPFHIRERNRSLGLPSGVFAQQRLLKGNTNRWTDNETYTVTLGLKADGSRGIEVVDHTIRRTAGIANSWCFHACRGPTVTTTQGCLWNGAAERDPIGDYLIQAALSFGGTTLFRVVGAGAMRFYARRFADIAGSSARNACGFCVLSDLTGRSIDDVANITGFPVGRIPENILDEMVQEVGLRIASKHNVTSWEQAFQIMQNSRRNHIVSFYLPDELVPAGSPNGHIVWFDGARAVNGAPLPVDPSRNLVGPDVISGVVDGQRILIPVRRIVIRTLE